MNHAQSKARERGKAHRNVQQLTRKIDKLVREMNASGVTNHSKLSEHSELVMKRTRLLRQLGKGY